MFCVKFKAGLAPLYYRKTKKLREKRQYTQKQLAELSGISESALRSYELGDRKPKKEVLEHIAKALRVRPEYLSTPEFGPHLEFSTRFWRTTSCMDTPSPRLTVDPPSPAVSIPLACISTASSGTGTR